jgi:hypothetical protein
MSAAVQALIASFDALSEAERHEAIVVILRRSLDEGAAAPSDDELVRAAEERFLGLEAREATEDDSSIVPSPAQ